VLLEIAQNPIETYGAMALLTVVITWGLRKIVESVLDLAKRVGSLETVIKELIIKLDEKNKDE